MKKFTLILILLIAAGNPVWAAAPDLLPPLSMQVDPGDGVVARGLDFLHAPLSGAVNFTPQNYDVHLPGGVILQVEDVVPYFGIQQPVKDCQGAADIATSMMFSMVDIIADYILPKVLGADPKTIEEEKKKLDPKGLYNGILDACNNNPQAIDQLLTQGKLAKQIVADVRNSKVGATDVTFSGQLLDPYTDFPLATQGYGAAVIGGTTANGTDVWSDGIVMASYEPQFAGTFGPLMSSSLNLYRFIPNTASKKVLKRVGISTGWLDKPVMTNGKITNPCFKENPGDPKNPAIMKNSQELLDAGCVGENLAVAVATPNFYGHPGDKLKDIVVVSRAPYGDSKNLASKVGYITIYKRNATLPAPADTSLFQEIWQFDRSVTHSGTGIPESYGIAVLRNWDPKANKMTEGVIVGSNQLFGAPQFGTQYYVFYFANGMAEPKPISVGEGFNPELPGFGGFGPYRIYSEDVNSDRCGDILITRAKIDPKGTTIQFADYFDVHVQVKDAAGLCTGDFDKKGDKYKVPALDPQKLPQLSSLAIADFNKDGHNDVMAADFTTYVNSTTKIRENVAHFLEYKGGIFNTIQPPRYVVTTKGHDSDVGPIDIKADAHANLGVVIGKPMKLEMVTLKEDVVVKSDACGVGGQKYDASWLDIELAPGVKNDTDNDGIPDCVVYQSGGKPTTGSCKMLCDNCSQYLNVPKAAACKADPSGCTNPDQKDTDADKTGDACDAFPNDDTQSKRTKPLREDKVMYADDQPVIAEYQELKTVAVPAPVDNGHEVVVLLNKTNAKGTPKECVNGDLACICEKNPDLQVCKCLKDPKAPGCQPTPESPPVCSVDVCRGDLTAPFPRMCDSIRPYNDEIRKCTGLNSDFLIPVEGAQYHVSCTMPNTPALDLGNGMAYTRIYKTGQLPKNYFKDWHKPVAEENISPKPILLTQPNKAPDGTDLDLSPLPNPGFDADPLLSVVPNATLNQAPGIAQIDGVMEIQTNLVDMSGVAGAGKALPGGAAKVLSLDIKAFSSPPGCQWAGDDCPKPMPNPPSPQEFVNVICAAAKAAETAGKPVTIDTVNEAFNAMNVGPGFLHQKFVIPGVNTQTVLPVQYAMPSQSAEGGCGCTITATSTLHNTALPLLMAVSALGGMLFFRRNTAKKR